MRRRTILLAAAGGALVAAPVAAYVGLVVLTRDAPEPAALGDAPTEDGGAGGAGEAAGNDPGGPEGDWVVADVDTNFVGYRVRERLGPVAAPSDAVGRSTEVEGTVRVEGERLTALAVAVDVGSLTSGSPRRDEFVRDEALEAARFPSARLRLAAAGGGTVEVGRPEPGEVVEVDVPAELTLRDETHHVVFAVQARWNGPTVQAAGSTEIRRSDFGIDVSSRAGFHIDEVGTVEFELTFVPAGVDAGRPGGGPPPTLVDSRVAPTDEGELRPPCTSDAPVVLDPPVLVTTVTADAAAVERVTGRGDTTPVVDVAGLAGGAAWSPDGTEVVVSASPTPEAPRTLAVVPADGGATRAIPGLADVTHPDWGPDGTIVFVRWSGETSDVWVAGTDGAGARLLVATPGVDADPRWSPDGRSVVFTTSVEGANQDVVLVGVDAGADRTDRAAGGATSDDLRTVAGGPGYEYTPSFAPDGDEVLFVRDGEVFAVGLDGPEGQDERRLTEGPSDVNPELSPDGEHLAYLHEGSLFVAAADGSDPRCVETGRAVGGGPRWRPRA